MYRYINTLSDLRREVSDQVDYVDMSQYSLEYDDLVEAVTDDLETLLVNDYDFKWGMEMPEVESDVFWDLFKPYEKD